jgi:hypothetical protein
MIRIGYKLFKINMEEYNEIEYLALFMLILSLLENASVMKFFIHLDLGGLIQLVPLKILRYVHFFGSGIRYGTIILRLVYLILDLIILECFLCFKDQAFSSVFQQYNKRVGLDVVIRNGFIVSSNFNLGKKFLHKCCK